MAGGETPPLRIEVVCFCDRGEVGCYRQDGGSKPPPYRDLFVSVIETRCNLAFSSGEGGGEADG